MAFIGFFKDIPDDNNYVYLDPSLNLSLVEDNNITKIYKNKFYFMDLNSYNIYYVENMNLYKLCNCSLPECRDIELIVIGKDKKRIRINDVEQDVLEIDEGCYKTFNVSSGKCIKYCIV